MSEIYGYQGQIYAPLATPAGTPILVIPQGTRLAGWDGAFEVAPY